MSRTASRDELLASYNAHTPVPLALPGGAIKGVVKPTLGSESSGGLATANPAVPTVGSGSGDAVPFLLRKNGSAIISCTIHFLPHSIASSTLVTASARPPHNPDNPNKLNEPSVNIPNFSSSQPSGNPITASDPPQRTQAEPAIRQAARS